MILKRTMCLVFLTLFFSEWLYAQIPDNYYNAAYNKSEYELKTALFQIIKSSHNPVSYNSLWTHFQETDKKPNGKVWDMYSNCDFTFVNDQCGNYSNICDCYNREHSFPQSWFNDAMPMKADLFHIYPTDGKVNGYRSNYPFGETNGTMYGTGKLGSCTFPGYSKTVFEPADAYKGDFARSYFYMATRYQDVIGNWPGSDMLVKGNNAFVYTTWAINLLLSWHHSDPVGEKEIDRNNAAYSAQKNRNPFIDYPELVDLIWGDEFGQIFNPDIVVYPEINGASYACQNSSGNLYSTDPGKTNYIWQVENGAIEGTSNNAEVLIHWKNFTQGKITVQYTQDGVQSAVSELMVTLNPRPVPQISGNTILLQNTEGHTYSTTAGMTNYSWNFSGNIALSEGGGVDDYSAVIDCGDVGLGVIYLNYTQNGCSALESTVLNIQIVDALAIEEQSSWEKNITIAPNPGSDFVTISFSRPFSGILLMYNMLGVNCYQLSLQSTLSQKIDVSSYHQGMCILKIVPEKAPQIHRKVMIAR